jgi:hypothetical protein
VIGSAAHSAASAATGSGANCAPTSRSLSATLKMVGALGDRELAHDLGVVDPRRVAPVRLAPIQRAVGQPHERVGVAGVRDPADAGRDGHP